MTHKDFEITEKARAAVFNIFTALLCQPDQEIIDSPKIFDALASNFNVACPDCASDAILLKNDIRKYSHTELLIEYTRLFIGPSKMAAPPYSSIYFGKEYSLMNDETFWVLGFYNRMGLWYDEKIKDIPDHIAVETEFMYYMIFLETTAFRKKEMGRAKKTWRNQTEFFNKHYKKWVPEFCSRIIANTKNDYYKSLATCLSRFVNTSEIPEFPKSERKNYRK